MNVEVYSLNSDGQTFVYDEDALEWKNLLHLFASSFSCQIIGNRREYTDAWKKWLPSVKTVNDYIKYLWNQNFNMNTIDLNYSQRGLFTEKPNLFPTKGTEHVLNDILEFCKIVHDDDNEKHFYREGSDFVINVASLQVTGYEICDNYIEMIQELFLNKKTNFDFYGLQYRLSDVNWVFIEEVLTTESLYPIYGIPLLTK